MKRILLLLLTLLALRELHWYVTVARPFLDRPNASCPNHALPPQPLECRQ